MRVPCQRTKVGDDGVRGVNNLQLDSAAVLIVQAAHLAGVQGLRYGHPDRAVVGDGDEVEARCGQQGGKIRRDILRGGDQTVRPDRRQKCAAGSVIRDGEGGDAGIGKGEVVADRATRHRKGRAGQVRGRAD